MAFYFLIIPESRAFTVIITSQFWLINFLKLEFIIVLCPQLTRVFTVGWKTVGTHKLATMNPWPFDLLRITRGMRLVIWLGDQLEGVSWREISMKTFTCWLVGISEERTLLGECSVYWNGVSETRTSVERPLLYTVSATVRPQYSELECSIYWNALLTSI